MTDLMDEKSNPEKAVGRFNEGFNCAQSVLSAYSEKYGLDNESALKVSTAFGAGMGRMSETCGAVTGAFMVIGLKYGMYKATDQEAKEKTYAKVKEFVRLFRKKNGTVVCKELLGYDMGTPEGMKALKELKLTAKICPGLVRDAATILDEIL
jgi:C_GCAxxG_C_C family probable redox protein